MTSEEVPGGRGDATSLFIGGVVALATIAIGIGLVFIASTGASRDGGTAGPNAAGTTETSTTSTSTASTTSSTTTTTRAGGTGSTTTTAPSGTGGGSGGQAQQPGRAYSDPEDDPYEPVPLPAGISATLTPGSCAWSAQNGGELQAAGTVSASPETDDIWFIDVYWLQNDRELDSQTDVIELDPGTTMPWRLTIAAPLPPADPFRCALEIS